MPARAPEEAAPRVAAVGSLPPPSACARNSTIPASPASAITPTCDHAVGSASTTQAASVIKPMRARSVHSLPAMPHTACATTATATTLSPCSTPGGSASPWRARPSAKRISAIAEGSVKPAHAASAPRYPARCSPSAMPTWLLAGPGRNWHSATRSA